MIEVRKTSEFENWLTNLRDRRAIARVVTRIARVEAGLMGDVKYFDGIGELRIDYGPGYRIYFPILRVRATGFQPVCFS